MRYGVCSDIDLAKIKRRIGALEARQYEKQNAGKLTMAQLKANIDFAQELKKILKNKRF